MRQRGGHGRSCDGRLAMGLDRPAPPGVPLSDERGSCHDCGGAVPVQPRAVSDRADRRQTRRDGACRRTSRIGRGADRPAALQPRAASTGWGSRSERRPGTSSQAIRTPSARRMRASSPGRASMLLGGIPNKFWPGPPDLAIEVTSPRDRRGEVESKTRSWLEAGTKAVVVIDPRRRTAVIHRPDGSIPRVRRRRPAASSKTSCRASRPRSTTSSPEPAAPLSRARSSRSGSRPGRARSTAASRPRGCGTAASRARCPARRGPPGRPPCRRR